MPTNYYCSNYKMWQKPTNSDRPSDDTHGYSTLHKHLSRRCYLLSCWQPFSNLSQESRPEIVRIITLMTVPWRFPEEARQLAAQRPAGLRCCSAVSLNRWCVATRRRGWCWSLSIWSFLFCLGFWNWIIFYWYNIFLYFWYTYDL